MTKLAISPDLKLPRDTQTSTLVIYGGKGMGKTNLAAVLCEEYARAGLRFSALDPMGVLWGLRHSKDGKGSGLEVLILGGRHGDLPIEPTAGAVVADLVADEDVSVIIDIKCHANGKTWTRGERIRFVKEYCARLYERQGETMRPLSQIIDECGRYCPQMIPHGSPDLAACTEAVATLVEEGRNVAVGVVLITQRSARMNKAVSELADCMVAFRTVGPNSVTAILDWFGEHVEKKRWADYIEQLRKLPRGEALVVSPGWLDFEGKVQIRERETFDSSQTPGAKERRATGGKQPDLGKYRQRMAATIEKAESEDPKKLRQRIAQLEREAGAARQLKSAAGSLGQVKTVEVEVPILKAAQVDQLGRIADRLDKIAERAAGASTDIREAVFGAVRAKPLKGVFAKVETVRGQEPARGAPVVDFREPREASEAANGLRAGARRMLHQLATFYPKRLSRTELGVLTCIHEGGGTFSDYLGNLVKAGLVIVESGAIGLVHRPPAAPPPQSSGEIVAAQSKTLRAGARRMLDALVEVYPDDLTKAELSARTGVVDTGGTFSDYLGQLRRRGLATAEAGRVRAAEVLFWGGR